MGAYIALDFETANEHRWSPCAVGVVRIEAGEVTDAWDTLIDPETYFSPMNVMIHGITEKAVVKAPTFPAVLDRILGSAYGADVVVAHSAFFDVQVLTASVVRYGLDLEPLTFACTRVFSRRWWPGWPSYGLVHVIRELNLFQTLGDWAHHNALWDARACAAIAERGFFDQGVVSWADAAEAAQIRLGILDPARYHGCIGRNNAKITAARPDEADLDPRHPVYGMNVAFTGALQLYTRRHAAQTVADMGGYFSSNVTKKTDLLVVGTQDLGRIGQDGMSSKMRKAVQMSAGGHHIEIIEESDFYQLLSVRGGVDS